MAKFGGFSNDGLAFFKALAFHQDREWFHANKELYEAEVKEPMLELLDALSARFETMGIPLRGDKRSMFRINRDVRFAKDKRPYQTHTGAVLTRSGGKDDPGLLYVHISAPDLESMGGTVTGSFTAAGFHMPDSDTLLSFRNAIKKDPDGFLELEAQLKKAKLPLITTSALTRIPRGFEDMKGSNVEHALKLKRLMVEEKLPESVVKSPKLVDRLAKFAERSLPLLEFGWKAIV